MAELISIKIKTQKNKISKNTDDNFIVIEINGDLAIKEQVSESAITQLNNKDRVKVLVSNLKSIRINEDWIEPLISWAWENRVGNEMEFTIRNIKYDEANGIVFEKGNTEIALKVEDLKFEMLGEERSFQLPYFFDNFEMSESVPEAKNPLHDFAVLLKDLFQNFDSENFVASFCSRLAEYKNPAPENQKYNHLSSRKRVKKVKTEL